VQVFVIPKLAVGWEIGRSDSSSRGTGLSRSTVSVLDALQQGYPESRGTGLSRSTVSVLDALQWTRKEKTHASSEKPLPTLIKEKEPL